MFDQKNTEYRVLISILLLFLIDITVCYFLFKPSLFFYCCLPTSSHQSSVVRILASSVNSCLPPAGSVQLVLACALKMRRIIAVYFAGCWWSHGGVFGRSCFRGRNYSCQHGCHVRTTGSLIFFAGKCYTLFPLFSHGLWNKYFTEKKNCCTI